MRIPLTRQLLDEAQRFGLRSSCQHCLFYVPAQDRCAHGWPTHEQRRWPLDAPDQHGALPEHAAFCKEHELA